MIRYYLARRLFPSSYTRIAFPSRLLLLSLTLSWQWLGPFDAYLLQLIQQLRSPLLENSMLLATLVGDRYMQLALVSALGGLLLLYRKWAALFFTSASILIGYGVT